MSKSATIIDPIHPGEILREEFLDEYKLSATAFAKHLGVPPNRITRLIKGTASVTADTAFLLAAALKTTPDFWLNLQTQFDLERARSNPETSRKVQAVRPYVQA